MHILVCEPLLKRRRKDISNVHWTAWWMIKEGTMALHAFKRLSLPTLNAYNECFVCAFLTQSRGYAKKAVTKAKGKGMVKEVVKGPEVCKDPVKLCTHAVGVNIFKQGEDPPLKPKEEYPDWLFQLDLGPTKKLNELDPDSREYWNLLRKEHIWRHNKLHKGKKM